MAERSLTAGLIALAAGYLAALSVAMTRVSYDIWGALLLLPVYGALGAIAVRWLFRDAPRVATVLMLGLPVKAAGAVARYYVGFEAYEGGIDAARYHAYAVAKVGAIRTGGLSWLDLIPGDIGTPFVEDLTALVYAVTGGSQLGGFLTFSLLAYLGVALLVKAALVAVPGLRAVRYAIFCALFPSLVYWPSSIGKEAVMTFFLGTATLGIAYVYTRANWTGPLLLVAGGMGLAAFVRPHVAGIWLAGAFPGLLVALVRGTRRARVGQRTPRRASILPVIALAAIAVGVSSSAAVEYLAPAADETESTGDVLTSILEETQRRTLQAGSQFTPPSVSNPITWPYAAVRTLTRPLPHEVQGLAQAFTGAEMAALLGLYAVTWRRLANAPHLALRVPYVAFALTTLFLSGLAYSSFANLAVLTRQKSLVFPLLLLLACLPTRAESATEGADRRVASDDRSVPEPRNLAAATMTGAQIHPARHGAWPNERG
jgi:hypothetical protein